MAELQASGPKIMEIGTFWVEVEEIFVQGKINSSKHVGTKLTVEIEYLEYSGINSIMVEL